MPPGPMPCTRSIRAGWALRINFGTAWKVALTAELFGGGSGLGYLMNLARQSFDTAMIFHDL